MTFEDYVKKKKAEPIFSLFIKDGDASLSTENNLKIDWIAQCTKDGTVIEESFLEDTFKSLLKEMYLYFEEGADIQVLLGGFRVFLLYWPISDREQYDTRLVSFFTDIVASDYDKGIYSELTFDIIFRFIVSWSNYRPQFLMEVSLGVTPQEFATLGAFFIRRNQDIVKYRDSDYPAMKTIASYMLYMYDLLKAGVSGRKIIDVVKAKSYLLSCMRILRVSCRNNGYDDQEKIEQIIKRIENEDENIMNKPTVFISYNWGSESTADEVEIRLQPIAKVLRDKSSIKPWGSITEFMKRIRETDLVVVIVSDSYLKSVNCLYEVMQLLKDDNWKTHSMFLVEDSAKGIYKALEQLEYINYWNDEADNLEAALKKLSPAQVTNQAEELKKIKLIQFKINDFIKSVADSNNPDIDRAIDAVVERVKSGIG